MRVKWIGESGRGMAHGEVYDVISNNQFTKQYTVLNGYGCRADWCHSRFELVKEEETQQDVVNKPSHYQLKGLGCEIKDVRKAILDGVEDKTSAWAIDCWSRSWEYLARMWAKHDCPLEDAKKARVYLDWLIEELEENKSE